MVKTQLPSIKIISSTSHNENKELLPQRLLMLHNFSSLFVSKSVCVIVGTCIQQLLIGLLFLSLLREPAYIRDPSGVHYQHLRLLSPAHQVLAYGGVWFLLLIIDSILALFAQRQLLRATRLLIGSVEENAVERYILRSATPSEIDEAEEGAELDLTTEEGSLLNPVREELSAWIQRDAKRSKFLGETPHSDAHRTGERLSVGSDRPGERLSVFLTEEPRIVIDRFFLRFVGWQVISAAFIGIPTWAVPDVVSAMQIWLIDIFDRPNFPDYFQYFPPAILAVGNLFIATVVIILINLFFIRRKQHELKKERKEEITRLISPRNRSHSHDSPDHLSRSKNQTKRFSQFVAINIVLCSGFAVGISIEMLVDYLAEDLVSGSYVLEMLSAVIVTLVVALIQYKLLDTSDDPPISVSFLINFRRFLSTSLSFLAAWSIKYAVIDTKDLLLRLSKPHSAPPIAYPIATTLTTSNQTTSVFPATTIPATTIPAITIPATTIPATIIPVLDILELEKAIQTNVVSGFAMLNPFGDSRITSLIHLPIAAEFIVATVCTLLFGSIVGLLTLWQNNAIKRKHRFRYRKHVIQLVILACGTLIGWSWTVFISVVYEKVVLSNSKPADDRPWLSGECKEHMYRIRTEHV